MSATDRLNEMLEDLRRRGARLGEQGRGTPQILGSYKAVLTSIRGLNEFRGNDARLRVLVDGLLARMTALENLIEEGEAGRRK